MTRKSRSPHKMSLLQFVEYHDTENIETRSSQNGDQIPQTPPPSTPPRQYISSPEPLSPHSHCANDQACLTSPYLSSPAESDTATPEEIIHILNSPTAPAAAAMASNRPSTPAPADSSSTHGVKRPLSSTPPAPITPIKYQDVKTPSQSLLPSPTPSWSSIVRGNKTPLTPSPSRSPTDAKISGGWSQSSSTFGTSFDNKLTSQLSNEVNKSIKDVEVADTKAEKPTEEHTPEEKAIIAAEVARMLKAKSIETCEFEKKRIDQLIARSLDRSVSENERYFAGIAATVAKYYVHEARKTNHQPVQHGIKFGQRRGWPIVATLEQFYSLIPQRWQHLVDDRNVHSDKGSEPAVLIGNETWIDENLMNAILHLRYLEEEERESGMVWGMNIGSSINIHLNQMWKTAHGLPWLKYMVNELRAKAGEFQNEAIERFRAENGDVAKTYTLPRDTRGVVYFWNFSGVHWLAIMIEMDTTGEYPWVHWICDSLRKTFDWDKIADASADIEELIQDLSGFRPPRDSFDPYYYMKATSSSIQQNSNDCGAFSTWNTLYMLKNCLAPPTDVSAVEIRKEFMQNILEALQNIFGPADALDNEETGDSIEEDKTIEKVEVTTPSSRNGESEGMSSASTPEKSIPIDLRLVESPTPSLDSTLSSTQASQNSMSGNAAEDFVVIEEPAPSRSSSSPEPADIMITTPPSSSPIATQASNNEPSEEISSASSSLAPGLETQSLEPLRFETPDEVVAAIAGSDPLPGREDLEAYFRQRSAEGDPCAACIFQKIYEKRMEGVMPNHGNEAL